MPPPANNSNRPGPPRLLPLPLRFQRQQAPSYDWTRGARVSQVATEALVQIASSARVSQVAVEVLTSVVSPVTGGTIAGTSSLTLTLQKYRKDAGRDENVGNPSRPGAKFLLPLPLRFQRAQSRFNAGSTGQLRPITATFAGVGHLTATVPQHRHIAVTLAGHSTLTAALRKFFSASIHGTSSLTAGLHVRRHISVTLAGTSSLAVSVGGTDDLTVVFAGVGQLLTGGNVPSVGIAGTSSLTAAFKGQLGKVVIKGRSSLSANFHRAQFPVAIHGTSSLVIQQYDLGPKGARIAQLANEIAYYGSSPVVIMSQLTVEVARPRRGLHIWAKFGN